MLNYDCLIIIKTEMEKNIYLLYCKQVLKPKITVSKILAQHNKHLLSYIIFLITCLVLQLCKDKNNIRI